MSVDITKQDFNLLEEHWGKGKTAENVNNMRTSGIDDQAIGDRLQYFINRYKAQDMAATAKINALAEQNKEAAKEAQEDRETELRRTGKAERGLAFVGGIADSVSGGLGSYISSKTMPEATEAYADIAKDHSGYATGGELLGLFVPSGAAGAAIKYGAKLGKMAKGAIVGEKTSRSARAGGYLAEVGIRSTAASLEYNLQNALQKEAGTKKWEQGESFLRSTGADSLANMTFDMMFGGIGGAVRKVKENIATVDATIGLLGGKESVASARDAFYKALEIPGATTKEAAGAFFAKIAENVGPEASAMIAKMISKSPKFKSIVESQLSVADKIAYNNAKVLTDAEKGKAANNIIGWLGKTYTDATGAKQLGTTADDLVRYMGVNNKNFNEVKSAGLKEAQDKINQNFAEFEENTKVAGSLLRQDYEATKVVRDSANVADFSALQPSGYAEGEMNRFVQARKQKFIESRLANMQNVSPEEKQEAIAQLSHQFDSEMADGVKKQYAVTFADNIIKNGSSNVYDLMDMQNHVKNVMKKDVMQGSSTAPGKYHKEINRLLGAESDILDGALKAMSNADEMVALHELGEKYTDKSLSTLEAHLADAMDAKEAAAKLSGFKLGYENQLLDALIAGDTAKFESLMAATGPYGTLNKYFAKDELKNFVKDSAPKIIAANNIKTWLKAVKKYEDNTGLVDAVIRTFIAGAAGARVAGANSAVTVARKLSFGPKTMAVVEEFASNPSAEVFNKMLSTAKDTTERNLMQRVVEGLGDGINQYLIESGRILTQGD